MRTLRVRIWSLNEKIVKSFTEGLLNVNSTRPHLTRLFLPWKSSPVLLPFAFFPLLLTTLPCTSNFPQALPPPGSPPEPLLLLVWLIIYPFSLPPRAHSWPCACQTVLQWSAYSSPQSDYELIESNGYCVHFCILNGLLRAQEGIPRGEAGKWLGPRGEWLFVRCEFEL